MTEAEWQACTDPQQMLAFLKSIAGNRKLRLFAVACCRRICSLLPHDVGCQQAIVVAEQFADGNASAAHRTDVVAAAVASAAAFAAAAVGSPDEGDGRAFAAHAAYAASSLTGTGYAEEEVVVWSVAADAASAEEYFDEGEFCCQAKLLRDIFGNPFRPLQPKRGKWSGKEKLRGWLTQHSGTIPKLAQTIYDDRAFDRLPILADALVEAGYTNADILTHCRQPGEHVRGCWVVDLILGKN